MGGEGVGTFPACMIFFVKSTVSAGFFDELKSPARIVQFFFVGEEGGEGGGIFYGRNLNLTLAGYNLAAWNRRLQTLSFYVHTVV